MSIRMTCQQCGAIYELDDGWAGRRARCENCDAVIEVPQADVAAETKDPPPRRDDDRDGADDVPRLAEEAEDRKWGDDVPRLAKVDDDDAADRRKPPASMADEAPRGASSQQRDDGARNTDRSADSGRPPRTSKAASDQFLDMLAGLEGDAPAPPDASAADGAAGGTYEPVKPAPVRRAPSFEPAAPARPLPGSQRAEVSGKRVSITDIFVTPFDASVIADSIALTISGFLWMLGFVAVLFAAGMLQRGSQQVAEDLLIISSIVIWLGLMYFYFRWQSWMIGSYFAVIMQFESGAAVSGSPRGGLTGFLLATGVGIIGALPMGVVMLLMITTPRVGVSWIELNFAGPMAIGFFLSVLWLGLYYPMGMAIAGAYAEVNPVRVIGMIFKTFPAYILILLYWAPVVGLLWVLTMLAAGAMVLHLGQTVVGQIVLTFVLIVLVGTIVTYMGVAFMAMLGKLLLKYKHPQPWSAGEFAKGLGWIGGTMVANMVIIAIAGWTFFGPKPSLAGLVGGGDEKPGSSQTTSSGTPREDLFSTMGERNTVSPKQIVFKPISAAEPWPAAETLDDQLWPEGAIGPVRIRAPRIMTPKDYRLSTDTKEFEWNDGDSHERTCTLVIEISDQTNASQRRPWIIDWELSRVSLIGTVGGREFGRIENENSAPIKINNADQLYRSTGATATVEYAVIGGVPFTVFGNQHPTSNEYPRTKTFVAFIDGQTVVVRYEVNGHYERQIELLEAAARSFRWAPQETYVDPYPPELLVEKLGSVLYQGLGPRLIDMGARAEPALLSRLDSSEWSDRKAALEVLAHVATEKSISKLLEELQKPLPEWYAAEMRSLPKSILTQLDPEAFDPINMALEELESEEPKLYRQALDTLIEAPLDEERRDLVAAAAWKFWLVVHRDAADRKARMLLRRARDPALNLLERWHTADTVTTVIAALDNPDQRHEALTALAKMPDPRSVAPLARIILDSDVDYKLHDRAFAAMGRQGAAAERELIVLTEHDNHRVRTPALRILGEEGGYAAATKLAWLATQEAGSRNPRSHEAANSLRRIALRARMGDIVAAGDRRQVQPR